LMYFLVMQFVAKRTPTPQPQPGTDAQGLTTVPTMVKHANAWPREQLFDLRVYVTETAELARFDEDKLVWYEPGLLYSSDGKREDQTTRNINVTIAASADVRANLTSLWAHIYVSRLGTSPDPSSKQWAPLGTSAKHHPLIKQIKRKKVKATKNLLSGEFKDNVSETEAADQNTGIESELVPHWKSELTINLVDDQTIYPNAASIPPQVKDSLQIDESGPYMPVIFCNEMWSMRDSLVQVNSSTPKLPIALTFAPTTLMRWQLTAQMQTSMEMQATMHGEDTMEEMRRMFAETSPWLLALTGFVSLLHTLFDFLAFKNDITFWKNNKSMKGISLKSMLLNLFFQTVIFLYLMDSETSWMILGSSGVGLLIEVWKVGKAIKSVRVHTPPECRLPRLEIIPADSYTLSETKVHDDEAMRYLSLLFYPLIVGYSVYSLSYESHKSWYSWLLGSIVGCVYTFGFIMMTPQLFINYKLKSTAHMPWKTFMYKALNTFVDDLFAFIIKMPTMHRLSCLRDDLIFVVYLYQRWCYGVDAKRANEYGQVELDEAEAVPAIEPPTTAVPTVTPVSQDSAAQSAESHG